MKKNDIKKALKDLFLLYGLIEDRDLTSREVVLYLKPIFGDFKVGIVVFFTRLRSGYDLSFSLVMTNEKIGEFLAAALDHSAQAKGYPLRGRVYLSVDSVLFMHQSFKLERYSDLNINRKSLVDTEKELIEFINSTKNILDHNIHNIEFFNHKSIEDIFDYLDVHLCETTIGPAGAISIMAFFFLYKEKQDVEALFLKLKDDQGTMFSDVYQYIQMRYAL